MTCSVDGSLCQCRQRPGIFAAWRGLTCSALPRNARRRLRHGWARMPPRCRPAHTVLALPLPFRRQIVCPGATGADCGHFRWKPPGKVFQTCEYRGNHYYRFGNSDLPKFPEKPCNRWKILALAKHVDKMLKNQSDSRLFGMGSGLHDTLEVTGSSPVSPNESKSPAERDLAIPADGRQSGPKVDFLLSLTAVEGKSARPARPADPGRIVPSHRARRHHGGLPEASRRCQARRQIRLGGTFGQDDRSSRCQRC